MPWKEAAEPTESSVIREPTSCVICLAEATSEGTVACAANHVICVLVGVSMVVAAVLCFQSMPHAPLMASMVTAAAYFSAIYVCWFHSARGLPVVHRWF